MVQKVWCTMKGTVVLNISKLGKQGRAAPVGRATNSNGSKQFPMSQYTLSFGDLLRVIQRQYLLILLVTGVLVSVTVGYSLIQTPMYEASTRIFIGQYAE